MMQLLRRFANWVREWVTLHSRWRKYMRFDREQRILAAEHTSLATELGYAGCHHLEAAVKIARRCIGAEEALKRLARAIEREETEKPLPGLSAAQIERLAWLMEECGEVVHAAGKTLRHGYLSASPFGGPTNKIFLEREMGYVRAAIEAMAAAGDVRRGDVRQYQRRKLDDAQMWMHHQNRDQGSGIRKATK